MVGSDIDGYTARFNELARLVPHMVTQENQRVNHYIRGLALEIKVNVTSSRPTTIQSAVSMVNRLTTDGIKDGLFKKKENAGNKKRSNDQFKNQGRNDRNKRQRTRRNFTINHSHGSRTRMNRATTLGGNRPNPMLAIKENPNQGNNRNQACGRAFALGVAKAPQDPNIVTGIFSMNDHFATVLFDSEDLSSLAPSREVEFRIDLIPGAMLVAKSPYCHAPTEMQELSNQLKELQDKGKANIVANALSRKEWMKPRQVRALSKTIHSIIKARILEAHNEASKDVNTPAEMLRGLDK
ncbi:hypothetical protein Tco_0524001 [Tanacetum coccineum]